MSSLESWSQLRKKLRAAEQQTDALFNSYSHFHTPSSIAPTPSKEENEAETNIKKLLEQRQVLVDQLADLLESESTLTSSALKPNNLARHREILAENRRELKRIKQSISEARTRHNLLSTVRSDIDSYRTSNPEAEYFLQERQRIDNTHALLDGTLSQAYKVSQNLTFQQDLLASMNRRIGGAVSMMPGMNKLMSRIGSKKRRDSIIMGSLIAFCVLLLLYLL